MYNNIKKSLIPEVRIEAIDKYYNQDIDNITLYQQELYNELQDKEQFKNMSYKDFISFYSEQEINIREHTNYYIKLLEEYIDSSEYQQQTEKIWENKNEQIEKKTIIEERIEPTNLNITPYDYTVCLKKYNKLFDKDNGVILENHIIEAYNNKKFSEKEKNILYQMMYVNEANNNEAKQLRQHHDSILMPNGPKPRDIAEHLMKYYSLIMDTTSRDLYISNFQGGFKPFKPIEDNWLKYFNNGMYSVERNKKTGNTFIKRYKTNDRVLEHEIKEYIEDKRMPNYDFVTFENKLLDINKWEFREPTARPVFTRLTIPHKINPNAKGGEMEKWLKYALNYKGKDQLKGLFQYVGMVICESGFAKHQKMLIIYGLEGVGKSLVTKIVQKALGMDNCISPNIKKLTGKEATAFEYGQIIGKRLMVLEEIDGNKMENYSFFKQHTSGNSISVERKHKTPLDVQPKDVCHIIGVGNKPFELNNIDNAMLRRQLLIDMGHPLTKEMQKDDTFEYRILHNDEYLEWFLYQSLEAYKEMIDNKEDFLLAMDYSEQEELLYKHANSEEIIFNKYFSIHQDAYITKKLFSKLLNKLSEKEGVTVKSIRSPVWKNMIYESTNNKNNLRRVRKTINSNTEAIWSDIELLPEYNEEFFAWCPKCRQFTIKNEPCIYCKNKELIDELPKQNI